MVRARAAVRGRDEELAVLRAVSAGGGGQLVVVTGPAGIGRTALLDEAERLLGVAGVRVLPVRPGGGPRGDGDDPFALAPLVRAVRDRFEQFQDAGLAEALGAVARLSDAAGRDAADWAPAMVTASGDLFDRLGRRGRVALLADDVHLVAEPAPVLTAARRSGCLVLAAFEESARHAPGVAELLAAADQVVTLGPLADDVAESLTRRLPGARLDEAVPDILRTALGPLFGNPGTLLGTLADLRERGRLTVFRGRLCLRAPAEPIQLPTGHHLLRRTAALGVRAVRLLSSLAAWDGFVVADLPLLAEVIGTDLTECGRLLDRLIDAEVLVADPAGRVSCRCPALAASAVRPSDAHGGAALHASVAERLLARQRQGGAVDPMVLADHIAGGGAAVEIGADRVSWLLGLVSEAERKQPERAALWCLAALRRLSPGEPEHARTLTRLLDLVIRTGRYGLLREVLDQYAEQGCAPGSLAGVRLAAVLLALHSGEPPAEEAVRSLLDEAVTDRERAGFAQWWFGRPLGGGSPAEVGRGVSSAELRKKDSPAEVRGPVGTAQVQGPVDVAEVRGAHFPARVPERRPPVATGGPAHCLLTEPPLREAELLDLLSTALFGDLGACEQVWHRPARIAPSRGPDQRSRRTPDHLPSGPDRAHTGPDRPHPGPDQPYPGPDQPQTGPDQPHFPSGQPHLGPRQPHLDSARPRSSSDRTHAEAGRPEVATSAVDLATLTHLVLGARYQGPGAGVLGVYRKVVHGYTAADWSQAMSAVRELELSGGEDTLAHQAARLLAADMCAARGEARQAAQWLADVVPAPGLAGPRAWVRVGLLSAAGHDRRAALLALRVSRTLRRAEVHAGLHLLLMRAVRIAAFADDHTGAAELLAETESLCRESGTDATESLLLARGLVHRDIGSARQAAELARDRGDRPALLDTCLVVARFAEDPRPWLREAHALATRCGASWLLERVRAVTRERGVPAPRSPGRREDPAVTEQRIIELIGEGLTNRQIALRLRISEKTVENHLTRLFARTGCRSRVELVAASLGGRLTRTTD